VLCWQQSLVCNSLSAEACRAQVTVLQSMLMSHL